MYSQYSSDELEAQIEWLNEGVTMLMCLMNGRGIVGQDTAERAVYEEWRKRGRLVETNVARSEDVALR